MPSLAVTQPYIAKGHIELIDSNTDPNFNQIFSAYAAIQQALQAIIKLRNTNSVTGLPAPAGQYFRPKYITDVTTYESDVEAVITALKSANVALQPILTDANS